MNVNAKNLVAERKRLGLSREAVAQYVGRSAGLIGAWERGEKAPKIYPEGTKLAKLYDCSLDYLAGLKDQRN